MPVDIQFQAFSPSSLDVLPGETVEWTNISSRAHTVTADDDSFDSGDIEAGDRFERDLRRRSALYGYHCRLHAGMVGEVDVRRVTLGPLPTGLVQVGEPVEVEGRTADPSAPVADRAQHGRRLRDRRHGHARTPDGTWRTEVDRREDRRVPRPHGRGRQPTRAGCSSATAA